MTKLESAEKLINYGGNCCYIGGLYCSNCCLGYDDTKCLVEGKPDKVKAMAIKYKQEHIND